MSDNSSGYRPGPSSNRKVLVPVQCLQGPSFFCQSPDLYDQCMSGVPGYKEQRDQVCANVARPAECAKGPGVWCASDEMFEKCVGAFEPGETRASRCQLEFNQREFYEKEDPAQFGKALGDSGQCDTCQHWCASLQTFQTCYPATTVAQYQTACNINGQGKGHKCDNSNTGPSCSKAPPVNATTPLLTEAPKDTTVSSNLLSKDAQQQVNCAYPDYLCTSLKQYRECFPHGTSLEFRARCPNSEI